MTPGALPPGRRVYAIGDIHGCDDQLAALHRAIQTDLAENPIARPLMIHLGDYVDRGPDTAGVVARLIRGSKGLPAINLMGNHERTMLDALEGHGGAATDWLFTGGRTSLESWHIDPDTPRSAWLEKLPAAHLDFLGRLKLFHREGSYIFVHAGIRPGIALDDQARDDLLSIRMPFLYSDADHGAVIVHGHTPTDEPVLKPNRIGIDTGACFGGKLTCAILEGTDIAFLRV